MNKKIVLVTGGTSGIGLGTVQCLLDEGCYEVISYALEDKNAAIAKEKLGPDADRVTFLFGDISSEADCLRVRDEVESRLAGWMALRTARASSSWAASKSRPLPSGTSP